jgi:hypothetical protein
LMEMPWKETQIAGGVTTTSTPRLLAEKKCRGSVTVDTLREWDRKMWKSLDRMKTIWSAITVKLKEVRWSSGRAHNGFEVGAVRTYTRVNAGRLRVQEYYLKDAFCGSRVKTAVQSSQVGPEGSQAPPSQPRARRNFVGSFPQASLQIYQAAYD